MIFVAVIDGKPPINSASFCRWKWQKRYWQWHLLSWYKADPPFVHQQLERKLVNAELNGAPAHCIIEVKGFLVEKFRGRVIRRGTEIGWPALDGRFHPLNFYVWALAQRRLYAPKSSTITKVIGVVKQVSSQAARGALKGFRCTREG